MHAKVKQMGEWLKTNVAVVITFLVLGTGFASGYSVLNYKVDELMEHRADRSTHVGHDDVKNLRDDIKRLEDKIDRLEERAARREMRDRRRDLEPNGN